MNKFQEFKKWLNRLGQSRPATIALSVFFAVLIWFTVSVIVYPTTPVTFYNIPVVVDLKGTSAEKSGLSVVNCDVETVNVQIVGARSEVGILTEEDLTAYAVVQNVSTTGEYSLSITVRTDQNVDFEVNDVTPAKANVTFDKIETRTYDVTPSFPNIVITEGHTMDEVTCEPATIEIKGPSAQLDQIDHVVVASDKTEKIDTSYSLYSDAVVLYTKDGAILDTTGLELSNDKFLINIPLLTQKTLDLSYVVRNAPKSFDLPWLQERLALSETSITLASPNASAFAAQETFDIGYINLEDITLDYINTFDLQIPDGVTNQSGLQQATVSLNAEGLSKRNITVSGENISIINAPSTYDFKVVTQNLPITVIGPEEVLETLNAKDIFVTVDLMNHNAEQASSFSERCTIAITSSNRVWALGEYNIAIDRVDKVTDASADAEGE